MTEQTTSLYQAALFYKEHLSGKRFELTVERKNEQRKIELLFLPRHFHHLMGWHKLKDIPRLRKATESVYREILSKKITDADIQKSVYFDQIRERLIYHEELLRLLHVESVFFRSLHGRFKGIAAECVLTKPTSDNAGFGFLFMALQADVYFPCSFFTRDEMREYTKDGTRRQVVSVKEIRRYEG